MLTAALLASVVRRRKNEAEEEIMTSHMAQREKGERCLQELSSFHNRLCPPRTPPRLEKDDGRWPDTPDTLNSDLDDCHDTCKNQREDDADDDDNMRSAKATIIIQAQVRRYLQQSHYRIQVLERRLRAINEDKEASLQWTRQWKERKLQRAQRKYDRREQRLECEYQKVRGIVNYLERDRSLCQKEMERLQRHNQELQTENHHLRLAHESTNKALARKKQQLQELSETQHRLQVTVQVYREMTEQFRKRLHAEERPKQQPILLLERTKQGRRSNNRNNKAKTYETNIVVNSSNEMEEQCFHYRLVQDVYTLTPAARRTNSNTRTK